MKPKSTLCWECKKSGGLCSWSHNLTPVKGWVAEMVSKKTFYSPEDVTFCVIECPEFEEGKQCIHYEICNENADGNIVELMGKPCFRFMELVRCNKCELHDSCYAEDVFKLARMDLEKAFCCLGKERKTE